jgi:hypothetical protein
MADTAPVERKASSARRCLVPIAVCGVAILWYGGVSAFMLSPEGTELEKSIAKKYPGHWHRALLWAVDRGVPLFTEEKTLDGGSRMSLLARSHFGDLQFLHAMAAREGEPAGEKRRRIMMWTEFTWKVARGDFGLDARLRDVGVDGMTEFFGRADWRVQDLFTLGNPALRPRIKEVAFGSLLHMVQDSFAKGHVDRREATLGERCTGAPAHPAPGRILEFHSYIRQDPKKHAEYDSRDAFGRHWALERPTVVEVGQVLHDYFARAAGWDEANPVVECIFELEDADARATAGKGFRAGD